MLATPRDQTEKRNKQTRKGQEKQETFLAQSGLYSFYYKYVTTTNEIHPANLHKTHDFPFHPLPTYSLTRRKTPLPGVCTKRDDKSLY
jgi:hypothetical protein